MHVLQPFDWEAILAWLGARAIPGIEEVESNVYTRIAAQSVGAEQPRARPVRVTYDGEAIHANRELRRVRRLFDVDADPAAIHAVLRRDTMLAPLLRKRPGVRVPGAWDPFEMAVRAIVGQQVSVAAARTILGRIAATHGLTAEALSDVVVEGMPRKRAETIRLFAREVAAGVDVRDVRVPGVGPWTTSYIAMRLGDPDAFPAGDLVLRRNAGGLTERELLRRAEPWRPFRAYAAVLLWSR